MRTARHRLIVAFGVLAGVFVFSAAPAFAAPPEMPETGKASAVGATTATLEGGVLNPNAKGEAGESEYWFRVSETECEGESSTPPQAAAGYEKEAIPPVAMTNLQPNRRYTFCLIEHNLAGEYSLPGAPEHFTTEAAKPTVDSESGAGALFSSTEATLEAQIKPNNQPTTCKFEYGTSEALGTSTPCEPASLEGFPGQHASANLTGLSPNTVYFYRVAVENGAGKAEEVPIQELRTAPPAPTVAAEASNITDFSATLTGTVNPGSEGPESEAKYFFEYSTEETPPARTAPSQCRESCVLIPMEPLGVGPEKGGASGEVVSAKLEHLRPRATYNPTTGRYDYTTYHWRLVAFNGAGFFRRNAETADATFQTLPEPAGASTDPPFGVGAVTATVAGEVVSQGAATSYHFDYGATTAYDQSTGTRQVLAGVTRGGENVRATLTSLTPSATYHVRLVAKNGGGETQGQDRTFTTSASGEPAPGPLPGGFSLTGTAPAGAPASIYPSLIGLDPIPPAEAKAMEKSEPKAPSCQTRAKRLTSVKRLKAALEQCAEQKRKHRK